MSSLYESCEEILLVRYEISSLAAGRETFVTDSVGSDIHVSESYVRKKTPPFEASSMQHSSASYHDVVSNPSEVTHTDIDVKHNTQKNKNPFFKPIN